MSITIEVHEVDERKLPGAKRECKGVVVTFPSGWHEKSFVTLYQLYDDLQKELRLAKKSGGAS